MTENFYVQFLIRPLMSLSIKRWKKSKKKKNLTEPPQCDLKASTSP